MHQDLHKFRRSKLPFFFNLDSFSPEVGLFQCTLPTSEMHTLQGAKNRNWISRYEESLGFEASIKQ